MIYICWHRSRRPDPARRRNLPLMRGRAGRRIGWHQSRRPGAPPKPPSNARQRARAQSAAPAQVSPVIPATVQLARVRPNVAEYCIGVCVLMRHDLCRAPCAACRRPFTVPMVGGAPARSPPGRGHPCGEAASESAPGAEAGGGGEWPVRVRRRALRCPNGRPLTHDSCDSPSAKRQN